MATSLSSVPPSSKRQAKKEKAREEAERVKAQVSLISHANEASGPLAMHAPGAAGPAVFVF